MTIVEFLRASIAEDEAVAMRASPAPWTYGDIESVAGGSLYDADQMIAQILWDDDDTRPIRRPIYEREADANGAYMASHDPSRVLAECAAKRRIVELFAEAKSVYDTYLARQDYEGGHLNDLSIEVEALTPVIRALARPYADRAGYREEWRP
jgi:Family of unknown function (DUF6221)